MCETKWLVLIYFPCVKSLLLLFIKPKQKVFSRRIFFCEAFLLQLCCNTHSDHTRLKCFTFIMSTKTNHVFLPGNFLTSLCIEHKINLFCSLVIKLDCHDCFSLTKKKYFPNSCFTHGNKDKTKNKTTPKKSPFIPLLCFKHWNKKMYLEKRTKHHTWNKKPFSFFLNKIKMSFKNKIKIKLPLIKCWKYKISSWKYKQNFLQKIN